MAMMLLIHPETGAAITAKNRLEFESFVRGGYNPVGPRGQEIARQIRSTAEFRSL